MAMPCCGCESWQFSQVRGQSAARVLWMCLELRIHRLRRIPSSALRFSAPGPPPAELFAGGGSFALSSTLCSFGRAARPCGHPRWPIDSPSPSPHENIFNAAAQVSHAWPTCGATNKCSALLRLDARDEAADRSHKNQRDYHQLPELRTCRDSGTTVVLLVARYGRCHCITSVYHWHLLHYATHFQLAQVSVSSARLPGSTLCMASTCSRREAGPLVQNAPS